MFLEAVFPDAVNALPSGKASLNHSGIYMHPNCRDHFANTGSDDPKINFIEW
jgi:hypothetical protein